MSIETDKKEVIDFLTEIEAPAENTKKPLTIEKSTFLDAEEFQVLKDTTEEEGRERLEDVPEIPLREDFERTPYNDLFSALVADIGKVEVSNLEKDFFIKSLLNDTSFNTTSKVLGDRVSITIKSRTMFKDNLVFKALTKDEKDGTIAGVESMIQRLQAYVACMQISEINGKDYNLEISSKDSFEVNYDKLQAHLELYDNMQTHMWAAIVMAVRIHEHKSKICMDNLNNENFWGSVGIN